jgi:prolipoprotein diacylglyceryltransferase
MIIGILLFCFLWSVRKKITVPGKLFGLYLLVNGIERFFIEKIRVNSKYDILGFHPTQAEIISFLLIITGALLLIFLKPKAPSSATELNTEPGPEQSS